MDLWPDWCLVRGGDETNEDSMTTTTSVMVTSVVSVTVTRGTLHWSHSGQVTILVTLVITLD